MFKLKGKYSDAIIYSDFCDQFAVGTITKIINSEMFKNSNVAIMPDVHQSKGAVVGTTINNGNKFFDRVSPEIVGTDLGCGIMSAKTNLKYITNKELIELDNFITKNEIIKTFDTQPFISVLNSPISDSDVLSSTGTLGGGNHFIEVARGSDDYLWIIVHTGSRKFGKQIATHYIDQSVLNKGDLLNSITGSILSDYVDDLEVAQKYASMNRKSIIDGICLFLDCNLTEVIDSNHNYIDIKNNIIRKGATSSEFNEDIIIPINMRDGSLIAKGLGNSNWNNSAPHGAGRLLTRSDAKKLITMCDFKSDTSNIFTTSATRSKISEAPAAYKDLDYIKNSIIDTAELVDILKPIYNFKS